MTRSFHAIRVFRGLREQFFNRPAMIGQATNCFSVVSLMPGLYQWGANRRKVNRKSPPEIDPGRACRVAGEAMGLRLLWRPCRTNPLPKNAGQNGPKEAVRLE